MAKGAYIGVGGVAKKVKKMYIGVGGVAKKVKKAYIGVNGVAKLWWSGGGIYRTILQTSSSDKYYDSNEESPTTFTERSIASNSGGYYFKYDPVGQRFYALNDYSSSSSSAYYRTQIYYTTSIDGTTWTYAGNLPIYKSIGSSRLVSVDPTDGTLIDVYGASTQLYLRKTTVSSSGVSSQITTGYASYASSMGKTKAKRIGSYVCFVVNTSSSNQGAKPYYTTDFSSLTAGSVGTVSGAQVLMAQTGASTDPNPSIYYKNGTYTCYRILRTSSASVIQQSTSSNLTFSTFSGKVVSTSDLQTCVSDNVDGTDAVFNIKTAASSGFNSIGTWNWSEKLSSSTFNWHNSNEADGERVFHIGVDGSYLIYYCTSSYVWTAVQIPSGSGYYGLARAAV